MRQDRYSLAPASRLGLAALSALVAALAGIVAPCAGQALAGLLLCLLAIPLGIIGFIRAGRSGVHGARLSLVAILLGVIGAIAAFIVLLFDIAVSLLD